MNSEFIYHTSVRSLSLCSVMRRFFDLLREIKFFVTKENTNIEELYISEPVFLVNVTGHLYSFKGR
jgi:hypothetical protein